MNKKWLTTLLLSCLVFSARADSEPTIYEIVNNENEQAFSELLMLGYGIDDADNDGNTPLMIAASLGKVNFVHFLIDNGAETNNKNYNGETALHRAAQSGNNEIIDILFAAGADLNTPDFSGRTPLMQAVISERRFAVERLAALGAYLNWRDKNGESALTIAERRKFKPIADFLISKGAQH